MTRSDERIFVNRDSAWLWDLADSFERDDLATSLRLRNIATSLESLDEQNRNLRIGDPEGKYSAGIQEGYMRVFRRSNLPPQPVETMRLRMNRALANSNIQPKRFEIVHEAKAPPKPSAIAKAGITLNLGALK